MFESPPVWMWILGFLLVLGPLVTLHELGHYLVGRLFGVKADAFSVGFGKELAGYTDRRGTRWKLSALPLGGYVQFAGDMNPASQPTEEWLALPEAERNATFQAKPLWQRALIVAAGPVTNILIAVAVFAAFLMAFGKPVGSVPEVRQFAPGSPAQEAGLEVGDRIVAVGDRRLENFRDLLMEVAPYPDTVLQVRIERDGAERVVSVRTTGDTETDKYGNESKVGRLGVKSANRITREAVGPFVAIGLAAEECWRMTTLMVDGIGQILTGKRSVKELGGPLKIAKYSGEQLNEGWAAFVAFAALISLNLAFINLLPIPALDGGHLAFYAAEAIRRKPASPRSMELAYRTGIALVLALMLFVTVNDIASLPVFGG